MSDLLATTSPSSLSNDGGPTDRQPLLLPAAAEEFLPTPGRWAANLVRSVLIFAVVGSASLVIWPLRETVRAAGVVRPNGDNTVLQSEFGGRLQSVAVQANASVHKGQILAVIEPTGMREERRQLLQELDALQRQEHQARMEQQAIESQMSSIDQVSQALLETSRRSVDQARANQSFDRSELSRYAQLQQSGAVPRSLVDEKRARQLVSESEVSKALQGVQEQQARGINERARLFQNASQVRSSADELLKQVVQRRTRLRQVERALAESVLRSPLEASVVSTTLHHPGQVIQPGEAVLILAPLRSSVDVRLLVPTRDISQIRPGQPASLRIAACPTPEFGVLPARVTSLSQDTLPTAQGRPDADPPGSDGRQSPVAYEVRLEPLRNTLRSRQGLCRLRLGMEVTADVITRRTTVFAFLLNKLRLGSV
jgi:multidrug efflux pump subunit AcrA (membrane-fusion protein)